MFISGRSIGLDSSDLLQLAKLLIVLRWSVKIILRFRLALCRLRLLAKPVLSTKLRLKIHHSERISYGDQVNFI